MSEVSKLSAITAEKKAQVHPAAVVDPRAELASGVVVGPGAVIGPDVKIGPDTWISLVPALVLSHRTSSIAAHPQRW